jgi:hypothetical protein
MKFPDDETLRRIRETERAIPSAEERRKMDELARISTIAEKQAIENATRFRTHAERRALEDANRFRSQAERAIEDATRFRTLAEKQVTTEAARFWKQTEKQLAEQAAQALQFHVLDKAARDQASVAMQALGGLVLQERHRLASQISEIANVIGPSVRQHMDEFMKTIAIPMRDAYQGAAARYALDLAKTVNELQNKVASETLQNIRTLAGVDDAALRLALATIRDLKLEATTPAFSEFVTDALRQPEPLTGKTIDRLTKSHLSKKKISHLSKDQQFKLMAAVTILSVLVMVYSAWKMGQPVKIDPEQIGKLNQPQINITNVFQTIYPPEEPIYYMVMRDCNVVFKPSKPSTVIDSLASGNKVKLLLTSHQWIYVRYDESGTMKEGWVRKKYLKRLR